MKPFTSELYIKTSALTDERVCVGLFAISEGEKHFAYSNRKLRVARGLLSDDVYGSLEHSLRNMEKEIKRLNDPATLGLESDKFNDRSFEYLNRYAKGLLSFTNPRPVALEITDANFKRLFTKLVDEEYDKKPAVKVTFRNKVSRVLKREAFDKVDRAYTVTPELISNIYSNHEVDFIGKNGAILAGKSIDFSATPTTIEKHLLEYAGIARGLDKISKRRKFGKGEYYAYFEMPADKDARKMLDHARKNSDKGFELRELDELDKAADRIERGDYIKFSEAISD